MTPAEVPDELVEKAARALGMWAKGRARDAQKADVRTALAAVLPDIQAQALRDEAKVWGGSERVRMDTVHKRLEASAARLTATTEGPTT